MDVRKNLLAESVHSEGWYHYGGTIVVDEASKFLLTAMRAVIL